MKSFIKICMTGLMLCFFLVACGSIESKVQGSWKAVAGGETNSYMEIGEDRMVVRTLDEDPMTIEYILTESGDDNFLFEVIDPDSDEKELLFEGYFEDKNTIIALHGGDAEVGDVGLVRIDSISDEMEKETERAEAKAKEQAAKEKEEERKRTLEEEKEREKEEARRTKIREKNKERAAEDKEDAGSHQEAVEAEEHEADHVRGLERKYLQRADNLHDKIMADLKEIDPDAQDMRPGFYGQYHGEWDDLLNEVWGELEKSMTGDAFESLKAEQVEWIEMKEEHFDEMPDETASARGSGVDFLANETKDRTYYLIENYLE